MDLVDFFLALLNIGNTQRDNDRSVVGESPMETRIARFWWLVKAALVLAAIGGAVWHWTH